MRKPAFLQLNQQSGCIALQLTLGTMRRLNEPLHEKTNNVVFEQVLQQPSCTVTEDG